MFYKKKTNCNCKFQSITIKNGIVYDKDNVEVDIISVLESIYGEDTFDITTDSKIEDVVFTEEDN